jgi:hypothetical protein
VTEVETACPDGTLTFAAQDGALVMVFRETPAEPEVTITFRYNDCEMLLSCIAQMRKRQRYDFVLRQDAVKHGGNRLLFGTVTAKRGRVQFEVSAPFGLAGWRWDMAGADLAALEGEAVKALAQEDAKP